MDDKAKDSALPDDYLRLRSAVKGFCEAYQDGEKLAQRVREIDWSHNLVIIQRKIRRNGSLHPHDAQVWLAEKSMLRCGVQVSVAQMNK